MKETIWSQFKKIYNSHENGDIILTKSLQKKFNVSSRKYTLYMYMKLTTRCNFSEYIRPGVYKKLKNIPDIAKTTDLEAFQYDKTWRTWFCTFEDYVKRRRK